MHYRLAILIIVAGVSSSGVPIRHTTAEYRMECSGNNADISVAACTALIDSRRDSPQSLISDFSRRAEIYNRAHKYDRAIQDYEQAIRLSPDDPSAFYGLGTAEYRKGDYGSALYAFGLAIWLDPKNAKAFAGRGNADAREKMYGDAVWNYDQAIRLDPGNATTFYDRGLAYYHNQNYDSAIKDFDEAIRLNPKRPEGFVGRGVVYSRNGDTNRAVYDFNHAISLDAKYVPAFVNRGIAYERKGDLDRAIEDYDKAIILDPDDAIASLARGYAYSLKGDNERALQDYNYAVNVGWTADAFMARGITNVVLGRDERALTDFMWAAALDQADTYSAVWWSLALAKINRDNSGAFAQFMAKRRLARWSENFTRYTEYMHLKTWPGLIVNLYRGQVTPESVRAAATDVGQRCEAAYFIGEYESLHNNSTIANRLFQEAATECPRNYTYIAARAELNLVPVKPGF